jgi:hypothetical protein
MTHILRHTTSRDWIAGLCLLAFIIGVFAP